MRAEEASILAMEQGQVSRPSPIIVTTPRVPPPCSCPDYSLGLGYQYPNWGLSLLTGGILGTHLALLPTSPPDLSIRICKTGTFMSTLLAPQGNGQSLTLKSEQAHRQGQNAGRLAA